MEKGVTSAYYKSSFFSKYHPWLVEMGYPRLDVNEYEDGSWEIIEVMNGGYIPSEAQFNTVLHDIKHLEPSYSVIQRLVHSLDILRGEYWAKEMAKSKAVEDEHADVAKKRADLVDQTLAIVAKNDGLKERIARQGSSALDLRDIAKYIPRRRV